MQKSALKSVFEFKNYREYLLARFSVLGATRGLRTRWAEKINTKPAFVTQVLQGQIELGLEHVPPTNDFLGHSADEGHYFTLLVLRERAGTRELKAYFQNQIDEILEKRSNYLERIKAKDALNQAHQAIYYSQWYYSAIHLLVSIPQFQNRPALASRLKLPLATISRAVETLLELGLISEKNGRLQMSDKRVYLKKDSPYFSQMHAQYRNRAIQSLSAPDADDFHLSQSMSLSFADFQSLKKEILNLMAEFEPKIAASKEEEAFTLNIDLFKLV